MRSGPDGGAYEALSVINKLLTDGPSYQDLLFHFLGDRVVGPQEIRTKGFQCHHLPNPYVAASVLRKSDIFVDPSYSLVGRSMALEAMASGCACIMAKNRRRELSIKEFEGAVFFEPGDPEDLYRKLRILLDHSSLRLKLQKSAPNLPDCVDIYKSAAEMLALIKDIDEIPSLPSLDSPQFLKTKLAILDEEMEAFSSREHRLLFLEEELEKTRKTFQSCIGEYAIQKAQIERLEAKLGEKRG
jgi:glycosyltransferase involved in cell wall biosynthesis